MVRFWRHNRKIREICLHLIPKKYSPNTKSEIERTTLPILIKSNNISDGPTVLIVGAGIAGLSAGEYLIKNGIKNVKILEASKRIGGRIYSMNFGDTICEIGAKWFNENDSLDSLYKLAIDENLPISQLTHKKKYCLTHNGGYLNDNLIQSTASNFNYLLNTISSSTNRNDLNFERNSKKYLRDEIDKIIEKFPKNSKHIASKIFSAHENDLSGYFGNDLSIIHTNHLKNMALSFTKPVFISNGLTKIIEQLVKKFDENQILLGKPIEAIYWTKFHPLEKPIIHCMDGSKYLADHIICTLPLGPLKILNHLFFKPILPKEKLQAIFSLGYGCPIKIYLSYAQNISNWFPDIIKPIWGAQLLLNNESDWSTGITEISIVPNSQKVVEVKVNGSFSGLVENINHQEISNKVTSVLRRFIGRYDIPSPIEVLRSNWGTDVKYFGGIPFLSTLSDENNIKQLAAPLFSDQNSNKPTLLFAGDATISQGFGTLDGARKSGIKEAMRIVELYKNKTTI